MNVKIEIIGSWPAYPVRVLLTEHHSFNAKIMTRLLESSQIIKVACNIGNYSDLTEKLADFPVDMMIIDLNVRINDGYDYIIFMKKHYPAVKILAYIDVDNNFDIPTAIKVGVDSFIKKNADMKVMVDAVRNLHRSRIYNKQKAKDLLSEFIGTAHHGSETYNTLASSLEYPY